MIFIALMTGTILLCWFLNSTLLEKYYTSNKQNVLLTAYHNINEATSKGNTNSDTFKIEVQKLCGIYNITILIHNAKNMPHQFMCQRRCFVHRRCYDIGIRIHDQNADIVNTAKLLCTKQRR